MRDSETGTPFVAKEINPFSAGTLYHLAVTVDSDSNDLLLYRNGNQVASDTTAKGAFANTNPAIPFGAK